MTLKTFELDMTFQLKANLELVKLLLDVSDALFVYQCHRRTRLLSKMLDRLTTVYIKLMPPLRHSNRNSLGLSCDAVATFARKICKSS